MADETQLKKMLADGADAHKKGDFPGAERHFRAFLLEVPDHMNALNYLGRALADQGKSEEAVASFNRAITLYPDYPESYNNLGRALNSQKKFSAAREMFHKAVSLDPNNYIYAYNYGNSLYYFGLYKEAGDAYRHALKLNPNFPPVYVNLAIALAKLGNFYEAEELCQRAITMKPDFQFAYESLATIYEYQVKFASMIETYEKLLTLNPNHTEAIGQLVMLYQYMCDWPKWEIFKKKADEANRTLLAQGRPAATRPFVNIMYSDDEAENQKVAASHFGPIARAADAMNMKFDFSGHKQKKDKLIIGYISADMREQALGNNIQHLFGAHDKNKFVIHVYATNPDDKSQTRKVIEKGADKFFACDNMSEPAIAKLIYDNRVDILVDLTGFMSGQKLLVSALRPAPITVSYLGYLGTLGSSKIDYIIADKVLIPESQQKFYSEKCAYVPITLYVNHKDEKISPEPLTKKDFGLPEDAFVFNAHHSNYKIDSTIFEIWMRLLKRLDGSVLWLRELSQIGKNNLLEYAVKCGIERKRIFFSQKISREKYYKRLSVMDLGLDARVYSGGSTTMDSLWAGLPIVSLLGNHYASRMSASIINGVGLYDDLVTTSLEEYEQRAFELATDPQKLSVLRNKLKDNIPSCRLFDTRACAEGMENAYTEMWKIYCER